MMESYFLRFFGMFWKELCQALGVTSFCSPPVIKHLEKLFIKSLKDFLEKQLAL